MKKTLALFFLIVLCGPLIGCGSNMFLWPLLDNKTPEAPTNPPTLSNKDFRVGELDGTFYQASAPTAFLWPVDRVSEQTGELIALTYQEQVDVRSKIARLGGKLELYSGQLSQQVVTLTEKYLPQIKPLETLFTSQKCYSYCADCNATDKTILIVEKWIESDDLELQQAILACQDNQLARQALKQNWDLEVAEKVLPLKQQVDETKRAFVGTIGLRNFLPITQMKWSYSLSQEQNFGFTMELGWATQSYTSQTQGEADSIEILEFDPGNGFLTFVLPTVVTSQEQGDPKQLFFQVEFFKLGPYIKVDGDVKLVNLKGEERFGRFSSVGQVIPASR